MLEYDVKPEIEIFDLAMLYNAVSLIRRGLLDSAPHVQFVMGIPNALPARRSVLEFLIREYKEVIPGGTWTAAAVQVPPGITSLYSLIKNSRTDRRAGRALGMPITNCTCGALSNNPRLISETAL